MDPEVMLASDVLIHDLEFLYETKQMKEGLESARALLLEYPHDGRVWEIAGLLYRKHNNFKLAMCSLEIANTLIPLSVNAQIYLADCYVYFKKNDIALLMFEFLLEKKGVDDSLLNEIASRLEQMGEMKPALEARRRTCYEQKGTAVHHYSLAYHMGNSGYPFELVEIELKQAILLDPFNMEYKVTLADMLYQSDRIEEAYQYVKDMEITHISMMDCDCCLQKLASMFNTGGDTERLEVCLARIQLLKELSGESED